MKMAPQHLSKKTRAWWRHVTHDYELEEHHLHLLTLAGEALDRARQARETLDADGITYTNSQGNLCPHPCVAIERDSRNAFRQLIRELNLDNGAPVQEYSRPPTIAGRYK